MPATRAVVENYSGCYICQQRHPCSLVLQPSISGQWLVYQINVDHYGTHVQLNQYLSVLSTGEILVHSLLDCNLSFYCSENINTS